MEFPQLVGLKCSCCGKTTSSITQGDFCSRCCNPVHFGCMPSLGAAVPKDRCQSCGADPQSPIALEIKAEAQQQAISRTSLVCPKCGSTEGFGSVPEDGPPINFLVFGLLHSVVKAVTGGGEVECLKCRHIFEPPSRLRAGCIVLVALAVVGLLVLWARWRG